MLGGLSLALIFCCCLGSVLVLALVDDENAPTPLSRITDPLVGGAEQNVGAVLVPPTAPGDTAQAYHWPFDWKRYGLSYGIDDEVKQKVVSKHDALATRMGFVNGEKGVFRWSPPADCEPEPWRCVYHSVTRDNRAYVVPLAKAFADYQAANQLDPRTTIDLVISWVQHITYRLPDDENFGLLPPARVAAEGWGDCDSKTLLAALILDELGVETVVLHSDTYKHAALGVDLPGDGQRFSFGRRKYLYVEVTSPGWQVGTMPPEVSSARLWTAMSWK